MPQVIPQVIIAVVMMAASYGLQRLLAPRPGTPQAPGLLINTQDTQAPIKMLYGRVRVGVNRVFGHSAGGNNKTLHQGLTLGGGGAAGLDGLEELLLDDKPVSDYGDNVTYEFYNGTGTQDYSAALHAAAPSWVDPLRHTAYLYLRMTYDQEMFPDGEPTVTAVVRGRKLYDPRTGLTEWSQNGALAVWDLLTDPLDGLGYDPATRLDEDSFIDAANRIDALGYDFDGALVEREEGRDHLEEMLINFRGGLVDNGTRIKLRVLDFDTPVMPALTDDDIVAGSHGLELPSIQESFNTVRAKFYDADNKHVLGDLLVNDAAAINIDGEPRETEMMFSGVTDDVQVRKLVKYFTKRSRLDTHYSFQARARAMVLEPGDIVPVTTAHWGWVDQPVRVMEMAIHPNHLVDLVVQIEDADIYDDSVDTVEHEDYSVELPNPLEPPPCVANLVTTEETYLQGDNTMSRVLVTFDPPPDYPFFDHAEAHVSHDAGVTYRSLGKVGGSFSIEQLREGQSIYVKVRSASTFGVKQALADAMTSTISVLGVASAPGNVTSFQVVPNRESLTLRWNSITEGHLDLAYYEVRYGDSWMQSFLISRTRSVSLMLPSVRPGTHIFLIKARNTAGIYSNGAATASAKTHVAQGFSESAGSPWAEGYTGGTHNQTERDAGTGRLKVSAGYTTGDWTSPTHDLGSLVQRRFWITDLHLVYAGADLTWGSAIADDQAWGDVLSQAARWADLFSAVVCGTVRIELLHKVNVGDGWSIIDHFELLTAEVELRYFAIRLYIENATEINYIEVDPLNTRAFQGA